MAKCARCGAEMGSARACPSCGFVGESKSVLTKGIDKMGKATGTVLEKGVKAGDIVVKEAKPVVKTVAAGGKKGILKVRAGTLKAAKRLKREV